MSPLDGFRFQEPSFLWLVLAGVLVVLASWLRERRGRAIAYPGLSRLPRPLPSWRVLARRLPVALAGLGLAAGAVAAARPQHGTLRQNVTTQGVDIVVALDVSGSMAAEDFQPRNRLAVAKQVVADFVARRRSDRIGLVVFAAKALTKSPPTTDVGLLLRQLDDVHLDMLPDGTAVGSGLATALSRLRHSQAQSRIIVLVTDGANNTGEIDPTTATDMARAMQVRVYTIGVGKGGRVPVPVLVRDPFTGRTAKRTVPMEVDIDEGLLKRIAVRTSGEFFRAADPTSLRMIFDRIDQLEKSEIKLTAFKRYRELFHPVLILSALFLAAAGLAWAAGLRVAPR
ncbi:MAG: VWA domain-containing protein [Acidobacteriota bacterium]